MLTFMPGIMVYFCKTFLYKYSVLFSDNNFYKTNFPYDRKFTV